MSSFFKSVCNEEVYITGNQRALLPFLQQQMRIHQRSVQDSRLPSRYADKRNLPG